MLTGEQLLENAARDGSYNIDEWPRVLDTILNRLDQIIHEFPKPPIPTSELPQPPVVPSTPLQRDHVDDENPPSAATAAAADEQTDAPSTPPPSSRPPVPTFDHIASPNHTLTARIPPDTVAFYQSLRRALTVNFPTKPPHTLQRLAELVLRPRAHYKHLPQYLNALDRVVHVTSSAALFPLPASILPGGGNNNHGLPLTNGAGANPSASLGSDESLGGALLTPIPWLMRPPSSNTSNPAPSSELVSESTEMIDGPHGSGRVETVSVVNGVMTTTTTTTTSSSANNDNASLYNPSPSRGNDPDPNPDDAHPETTSTSTSSTATTVDPRPSGAVTQGELLRQEQEAGVVPASILSSGPSEAGPPTADDARAREAAEDAAGRPVAHATGPLEIGDEDVGPQPPGSGIGGVGRGTGKGEGGDGGDGGGNVGEEEEEEGRKDEDGDQEMRD